MRFFIAFVLCLFATTLHAAQVVVSGQSANHIQVKMVDSTDRVTPETGFTSGDFTVKWTMEGSAWATMTTPTVTEVGDGIYNLLCDELPSMTAGRNAQSMTFQFAASGAATTEILVTLVRPTQTLGDTITSSSGEVTASNAGGSGGGSAKLSGTLQSATSTTAVLASSTAAADDVLIGDRISITGGTGQGQSRTITDNVGSTDTVTVATWGTTPDNTSTYVVIDSSQVNDILADTADMQPKIGTPQDTLAADIAAVEGGVSQFTADRVASSSTFKLGSEGYRSSNIVSLNNWSSGTRTLGYDLRKYLDESDTTISTITAVTVVNNSTEASITTSNLRKHQNGVVIMWDTAAISTAGDYTVTVTFTTLDTNTVVVKGTLRVQ